MFDENHVLPELIREGTGYSTVNGYIIVRKPSHPYAKSNPYIKLHRLVMEQKLGRYLTPSEIVHHIDHDKLNNDVNNLELVTQSTHRTIHNKESMEYGSRYDLEKVRTLYESGKTTRDIEEIMGIGKSTVGYYVKKWGISRTGDSGNVHVNNPLNKRRVTDEEIAMINKLRREGKTIKSITELTGYSSYTIYKYLSKELIS